MSATCLFSSIRFFVFGFAVLLGVETSAHSDTVTVGNGQDPAGLPKAIYQAHDQGARDITIAPGSYDLPSMNDQDTILFAHWSDTTIHATGVTLIFEELDHRPVHFIRCENVTWDGGTLRFARPASTQGRITAVGSDDQGNYCDWKVDAGYCADMGTGKKTYVVVDQKTRLLKAGTRDIVVYPTTGSETASQASISREQTGPTTFRFRFPPEIAAMLAVNDWLVTGAKAGSSVVYLDGCKTCSMKNVTLQNGGFASFFETGGVGGNHYLSCKIQPGTRPAGATEDQIVGGGSDGFHSVNTGTGPDIEDCVYSGVFLDDCIAIQGSFDQVIAGNDHDLTLSSGRPVPKVGDPLRITDMHGFIAQAICTNVTENADHSVQVTLDQALQVPIHPDETTQDGAKALAERGPTWTLHIPKGTKASDPNDCGRGYKILRCQVGGTRSRGIIVKADDGLIDQCTIDGCGMSGVSIGPEYVWGEAGYCRNVTVSNNKFINCNEINGDQGTILIHGEGVIGNQNITIKDNTFDTCYGQSVIRAEWTDGVQITGNKFTKSFPLALKTRGNIIRLARCKNVKLLGNSVSEQGEAAGDLVGLDPSVQSADVQNNDTSGIQAAP